MMSILFEEKKVNGKSTIITPFKMPDNDLIVIYKANNRFTDLGETTMYLSTNDIKIDESKIKELLVGTNVQYKDGELFIEIDETETFGELIGDLITAIIRVSCLVYR